MTTQTSPEPPSRRESIARLFAEYPKEAHPERLRTLLDETAHIPAPDLALVVDRTVRAWTKLRAPTSGYINGLWTEMRIERDVAAAELAQERAPLPAPAEVDERARKALDVLVRARKVWEEGKAVPPRTVLGRVLAVMMVHQELGLAWPKLSPDQIERYEAALMDHERANPEAQINWWSDFKEACLQ